MGGAPHLRTVRAYGAIYRLLNVVNPALAVITSVSSRGRGPADSPGARRRGRDQRGYFRPLIADAVAGGETAFDGPFWDALRPAMVLAGVVANDVAVFLVGGWHDAFQRGAPLNYAALQNAFAGRPDEQPMQPGQSVSEAPRLMMGPWYHVSDFGGLHLHALQLRWFDYWLNDDAAAAISGSPFTFQAIGSPRWFHAREYPLPEATPTRFYLSQSGHLTADCAPQTSTATITYIGRGPLAGGGQTRYDQDNRRL
jgi:predicted acyl esterase